MSKESIIAFSQAKAEPLWLQDLRQAAFDKLESLALPKIERVKFHRWNLGDGTITENEPSANVPDFTALGNNPKLVQVGTNTVLEQLPADLISQGVVFTDLTTALEEIPEVVEPSLVRLWPTMRTNWQLITMLISIVQQSFMYQIMLKLTCQLKAIFTKMELQMFHLTNTF